MPDDSAQHTGKARARQGLCRERLH
jgi:hypothetical protein